MFCMYDDRTDLLHGALHLPLPLLLVLSALHAVSRHVQLFHCNTLLLLLKASETMQNMMQSDTSDNSATNAQAEQVL